MADFNTRKLIKKVEDRRKPLPFFLRRYFAPILEFMTEEINFDRLFRDRRLAPFVSPMVEGKVMELKGHSSKTFRPAYVKPKHTLRPDRALKRMAGEALNGSMSPKQRRQLLIAEMLMEEDEMIDNRLEWMAAQIIRTGQVVVSGEDYPSQTVDFGRDASLSEQLLTTARWNDASPDPLDDLETKSRAMSLLPFGAPATDIIFSPTPWGLFYKRADVKDLINKDYRGNESSSIQRGPENEANVVIYKGQVNNFNLFLDSRQYLDDFGAVQNFTPDGEVLLATPAIGGVQAFGAILDDDALEPARSWPKVYKKDDPSATITMTQSSPLPIPERENASARLIVI